MLVHKDVAQLAKKVGFDEPCLFILDLKTDRKHRAWNEEKNSEQNHSITLPYQFQLQKWLRDSHNIHVYATPYHNDSEDTYYGYSRIVSVDYTLFVQGMYFCYEKALQKALVEGLHFLRLKIEKDETENS